MAFEEQARAHGLTERTIEALLEEEYTSLDRLVTLCEEDMREMKIKLAERGVLRKWIEEINTSEPCTTKTLNPTVTGRALEAEVDSRQVEPCAHEKQSKQYFLEVSGAAMAEHKTVETPVSFQRGAANLTWTEQQRKRSETMEPPVYKQAEETSGARAGSWEHTSVGDCTPDPEDAGDPTDEDDVEEYIKKHGVLNLRKFLKRKLTKYKEMKVKIAITGQSGAGKSSFINCIRNLRTSDVGAAAMGVNETTMEVQQYPDPRNPNLVYCDMPGMGTPNFPKETYLDAVGFDTFDFFLIATCTRFHENDLYLAQEVHKRGKQFFFLRTKIDQDLDNDKNDNPNHDPDMLMAVIKNNCVKNLRSAGLPRGNIFVISSRLQLRAKYDFPKLIESIFDKAPAAKKTALILSLIACSEKGIEEKRKEFEKRITSVATMAALHETFSGSGESIILQEIQLYHQQFGLIETDLSKMGVNQSSLTKTVLGIIGRAAVVGVTIVVPELVVAAGAIASVLLATKSAKIKVRLGEALKECAEAAQEIIKNAQKQ